MKELEAYRMRAAAELDKDIASSEQIRPITGYVFREGKRIGVHIYDMSKSGGEVAVHLTETSDRESQLISRAVVESSVDVLKTFPDLKFNFHLGIKRFEKSFA